MASEPIPTPETTGGDAAHVVAKAALSAIPVVGGPAVELFQLLVQPPVERRRSEWMKGVGERLQALEAEGLRVADLEKNEQFVSAVLHTTQIAVRTHQRAKLEALQAALVNIARAHAPDEAKQYMFFAFIEGTSPLQLQILSLFSAPTPPPGMSMGGLSDVLEHNLPGLRGQRDLYDQLWKDLYARGFVNTEHLHMTMTGTGLASQRTTVLGEEFLAFIRVQ